MMDIDDVRLPEDIEQGAKGGPGFKTTIITLASGAEERNQEWSIARAQWDIGYGIQRRSSLQAVIDFFYARRGRARAFRYKDWLDFTALAEPMGVVAGQATKRQLQKTYSTNNAYVRIITLPVTGTVLVYVNDIALDPGDFSLGANGVVTFIGGDPGMNVKASFEFDIPVRFDLDNLTVGLNTYQEGDIQNIPVVELR